MITKASRCASDATVYTELRTLLNQKGADLLLRILLYPLYCLWFLAVTPVLADITDAPAATISTVRAITLTDRLAHPWGMAFLPNGSMLVSERPGRLRLVAPNGTLSPPLDGLPDITATGQGGLLDVVLHPQFAQNRWVYFSYSAGSRLTRQLGTEVARGQLGDGRLDNVEVIFRASPKAGGGRHFGGRLLFDRNGLLYISLGERGDKDRAQDLGDHNGSMIRLRDDGSVPDDNPFVGHAGARPEIYSYGHRNVQGLALAEDGETVWVLEHGPQGGDEVNRLAPGRNYGWPVITYGVNYGIGTQIGEGTEKTGMEQPVYYWNPSIAPSGMTFYQGDKFPEWRGNLLVGALKYQLLSRLVLRDGEVVEEEQLLRSELGRIRDVQVGPDGYVYLLTDEDPGRLVRLEPQP
ncbi:PQQ-dependent sugar dehydrogenase [Marinobacterium rhizophilum]|uniref:PQQ-dependent sugar dehydrogenase n=1 Tax=Marinobacterium rhizophilum TaxID=420402 RepID=UPI00036EA994|nr:PQQ-dependent sugar dehydrogenase [Marinobacterium rhizophilum]